MVLAVSQRRVWSLWPHCLNNLGHAHKLWSDYHFPGGRKQTMGELFFSPKLVNNVINFQTQLSTTDGHRRSVSVSPSVSLTEISYLDVQGSTSVISVIKPSSHKLSVEGYLLLRVSVSLRIS